MRCACLPDIGLLDLLARTESDGECLDWTGYAAGGTEPQWRVQGQFWLVRRLMWTLTRGPIRPKHQVAVSCGSDRCVHPDHLVSRTRSAVMTGKPKALKHRIGIALARRRASMLTPELVREVRGSAEPGNVIERRLGLQKGYASRIRRETVWKNYSSPFAGLGTP